MKHYIIAKFKDRDDTEKLLPEIKALFQKTLDLKGVESVIIHKSNSTRDNRYRIMIELLQNMAPDMDLVLLTLPISKLYSAERRTDFNNIIKTIASDYNLKIIDLGNVDISNDLCDSAHPYKSGMTIIANALVDGFEK